MTAATVKPTVDGGEAGASNAPAVEVKAPVKRKTRAAVQREQDQAAQAALADALLDSAETFAVTFPTGISVYVGKDVPEIAVQVGGAERWIEAVDGFVHLPFDGRVRAVTLNQLEDFRRMAGQSMLRIVPTVIPDEGEPVQ